MSKRPLENVKRFRRRHPNISRLRAFVRYHIVGINTVSGRIFDVLIIAMIFLAIGALILESMPEMAAFKSKLHVVEILVGAIFVIEYSARVWTARKPSVYIFSFWGIVDLLAIVPFVFQGFGFPFLRVLRVLRIFAILKVVEYTSASESLMLSLVASRNKIFVFLLSVTVLVLVIAFTMNLVEPQMFPTVPDAIWWTIVTITTVGYGDMVPVTFLGKTIASLTMLTAFGIIAVPTGVVAVEFQRAQVKKDGILCGRCKKNWHEGDANYCSRCGETLPEKA
ncbi:MAG: ion transporter [Deltaproteobacteria bacterium]|nr:ion transporter [Deltaproteobacteria bacterium]